MISLDCTGLKEKLPAENVFNKHWGKILIAELIIGTVGLALAAIGWLALSNPAMLDRGFIMICAGGAGVLSVFCAEMIVLTVHYGRQTGYCT
jgi:hypothetical protein